MNDTPARDGNGNEVRTCFPWKKRSGGRIALLSHVNGGTRRKKLEKRVEPTAHEKSIKGVLWYETGLHNRNPKTTSARQTSEPEKATKSVNRWPKIDVGTHAHKEASLQTQESRRAMGGSVVRHDIRYQAVTIAKTRICTEKEGGTPG